MVVVGVKSLVRDALPGDAEELTSLLLRSRTQAMPWLGNPHDESSTRWWMQHVLLAEHCVRVADDGRRLHGFAAVTDIWLEQLYVDPDHQGQGVGRTRWRTPSAYDPTDFDCTSSAATHPPNASTRPMASAS